MMSLHLFYPESKRGLKAFIYLFYYNSFVLLENLKTTKWSWKKRYEHWSHKIFSTKGLTCENIRNEKKKIATWRRNSLRVRICRKFEPWLRPISEWSRNVVFSSPFLQKMSPGASTPVLTDRVKYPHTYRILTSSAAFAAAELQIIHKFGWTKIATFHQAREPHIGVRSMICVFSVKLFPTHQFRLLTCFLAVPEFSPLFCPSLREYSRHFAPVSYSAV